MPYQQHFWYILSVSPSTSSGSRISRSGAPTRWERQPTIRTLFGENVCENKRIGSHGGGRPLDPSVLSVDMRTPGLDVITTGQILY